MKHQVTLDFEAEAVEGKIERGSKCVYIQIHFKMSKRFYKPIWRQVLLNDPNFVRYLVAQLQAYIENNWSQIIRSSQSLLDNTSTTYGPRVLFVQPGKNFYVSCSFSKPIPTADPPPDLNAFMNIPIRDI